ncbi:hypothetical protein CEP54_009583 [Fusarium duplospermum]|uniref:AB hydrolase-1 domain-containing protein n=1 Tax=Fusarium duplospermum TaxID=1325734 RepID=A0A428PPQ8_9HYPO|nr:hypothetical protein CEP54_009583 [Fusarium duplospermum]
MADQDPQFRRPDFFEEPFIDSESIKSTSKDASEGEESLGVFPETSADLPVVTNPLAREPIRPEAMCMRTTFNISMDWQMGSDMATDSNIVGRMYTTKPDGQPGWASYFLRQGFEVYLVDMPPSGRSNSLTEEHFKNRDPFPTWPITIQTVESELTAPGKVTADNPRIKYPSAKHHDKWPGTGLRGDPYFTNYFASLNSVFLKRLERQFMAQNSLQGLLQQIGKAFLIGEGTGGNMAWLAADVEPDLVAGVIAIEPVGPPFGKATRGKNSRKTFTQSMQRVDGLRLYGMTDIPLTFDPPANFHAGFDDHAQEPLDVEERVRPDRQGSCYLQRNMWQDEVVFNHETGEYEMSDRVQVRELYHLKKVPQAVVTAHASSHVMYDWATVAFMVQAGVPVQWIKLDEHQIFGNGHLMFLETNSDEIARLLTQWILNMTPEGFRVTLQDLVAPPGSGPVGGSSEEAVDQATARLQDVDMEDAEHAHSNEQLPVAQGNHSESAQPQHAEPVHRNDQLPTTQANRVGSAQPRQAPHVHHNNQPLTSQTDFVNLVQSEHTESTHHNNRLQGVQAPRVEPTQLPDIPETYAEFAIKPEEVDALVNSVQFEDTESPDRNEQSPDLEDYRDYLVLSEDEESLHSDHSSSSDEDHVDLVPTGYPETPHNSAQNSSDRSYEPSSGSDPSGNSSGFHDSDQSSGSHQHDDSPGAPQGNRASDSHPDNQFPGSQGNGNNPGQSQEHTSDISYINSSPSQSDDEIVISQRAVTPQNQPLSSLDSSQASSSVHEQSTNKRPPPSSSDPGSSPPATSWGPKRPRMATSPPAATYTPSVANTTPAGSQYTGDTSRWNRGQSVDSPMMSFATLRPANPAGPAQSRPRIVTTFSSPAYASSPPLGYSSDRESERAHGLAEPSPVQGQLRSASRDVRRYSPQTQSTPGGSHQGGSTQGYTPQGNSVQGYQTQAQSTQGYSTQNYSAQGHSAYGQTTQGSSSRGHNTQSYPHSTARFERQPGTAEESIASMARTNQARLTINTNRSTAANDELQYSPFTQPRILPSSQMNQANGTNNTGEASQATTPAPVAQPNPARPSTPEAPDSDVKEDWFSMFGGRPRATPPSPSPAPRGSSNPASSSVSRGSPARAKSLKRHASK